MLPLSALIETGPRSLSPIFSAQCQSEVRKVQLMAHNLCMLVPVAAASFSLLFWAQLQRVLSVYVTS